MSASTICLHSDLSTLRNRFQDCFQQQVRKFHLDMALTGYLVFPGHDTVQAVWLLDFSETGINFCTPHSVAVGTSLTFKCGPEGKASVASMTAIVNRTTRLDQDNWLVSCRFEAPVSLQTLQGLC